MLTNRQWLWPDQNAVDDRQDSRGRADAQGKCEDRNEREDGRAPQAANTVAEIEQRVLDERRGEFLSRAL